MRPPYIGVAYYPEAWPISQMGADIAGMRDCGITVVRMAEFAWCLMEPSEGEYCFEWLQDAVDKVTAAGIAVVLCTPTATPPIWLSDRRPEILRVGQMGQTIGHGGRRQYCPNSPVYRDYSQRIVDRLGAAFGRAAGVIAWQIDNEFWEDCYCPQCEEAFHRWLSARYTDIDHLNRAWNNVLWSQQYNRFDQVPLPNALRVGAWHHPSLVRAYREFMSDSYAEYCAGQAAILRTHTSAPLTTNAHNPVAHQIDYSTLFRDLDFVSFDCYAPVTKLSRYAFESDWMRPLKNRPYWFMETASSAGGHSGALRAKMWLMYALGADAVCFWLWRAHWGGQEMDHDSLMYAWGDERVDTHEIREVADEIRRHADWLASTSPKPAEIAVHYSVSSQWILGPAGINYDSAIAEFHHALFHNGIRCDVISPTHTVDEYKLVCTPYMPDISPEFRQRMQAYVEGGGAWVIGPLSAHKTGEATANIDAAYGRDFEDWLGIHVRHRERAIEGLRFVSPFGDSEARCWSDTFELTNATLMATYSGGAVDGLPAIVERRIGKGAVVVLGTLPGDEWIADFVRRAAHLPDHESSNGIVVFDRIDASGRVDGSITINTTNTDGFVSIQGEKSGVRGFEVVITQAS